MNRPDRLALEIVGMSPEAIERGVEAARRVFERAGVTPDEGAFGIAAREAWDIDGFPEEHHLYTGDVVRAATAWHDAEIAAMDACCADWRARRLSGGLVLLDDEH